MKRARFAIAWGLVAAIVAGCGETAPVDTEAPRVEDTGPGAISSTGIIPPTRGTCEPAPTPLTEEGLRAALKQANPELGDQFGIAADRGVILAVEANDRNLKDISPLFGDDHG